MIKRIALLVTLLLMAFSATCLAARIYVDNEYHYSIQLPDGFKTVPTKDGCIMSAADSKGATMDVTIRQGTAKEIKAENNKKAFRNLSADYLAEFEKQNFQIYNEYTININPDSYGYYLEGAPLDKHDLGISKNAYVKFIYLGQVYTVTYVSPYDSKDYLKNFSLFRKSINILK